MIVIDDGAGDPIDAPAKPDAGDGPPDADRIENPQTGEESLDACTTAERIDKAPSLPLRNEDGSLAPLLA